MIPSKAMVASETVQKIFSSKLYLTTSLSETPFHISDFNYASLQMLSESHGQREDTGFMIHCQKKVCAFSEEANVQRLCKSNYVLEVLFSTSDAIYSPPMPTLEFQLRNYEEPSMSLRKNIVKQLFFALMLVHNRGYSHNSIVPNSCYLLFNAHSAMFRLGNFSNARPLNSPTDKKLDFKLFLTLVSRILTWQYELNYNPDKDCPFYQLFLEIEPTLKIESNDEFTVRSSSFLVFFFFFVILC